MNISKQKNIIISASVFSLLFLLFYYFFLYNPNTGSIPTIAIVKTATHPALDQALAGFYDVVKERFGDEIIFKIKNTDGSVTAAQTIADSLYQDTDVVLFYAIATLALCALAQKEKERPIIFSAVTNPSILSLENQKNICGISDLVDVSKQIKHVLTFVPGATSVGIIFNGAEINSLYVVKQMEEELEKRNIRVHKISVMSAIEVPAALEQNINNIDVLIAPADNLVAIAASLIAQMCNNHKIPCVFADNLLLQYGATATCGVDYYEAGKIAGTMAISILEQVNTPNIIGFMDQKEAVFKVNKEIYETMKEKLYFDPATMKFNE